MNPLSLALNFAVQGLVLGGLVVYAATGSSTDFVWMASTAGAIVIGSLFVRSLRQY